MRAFSRFLVFLLIIFIPNLSLSQSYSTKNINGITVLSFDDKLSPIVSMQLWVGTGSVNEKEDEAGFAHFLEHLTFRSKDIAKRIEDLGGDINAYTTLDRTVYYLTLPKDYYEEGLKVLSDIFYSTEFTEQSFDTEKDVILEEMKRSYDDPQREIYKTFFEKTLKNHPAKRPVIGYEDTIKNAEKNAIISFYKNFYTNDNSFLVIVGDLTTQEELEKNILKYFKHKKFSGHTTTKTTKEEVRVNTGLHIKKKNIKSCYLMAGFLTPDIYSEDVPAIDVLSYIYGESPNSILSEELKEKKQLVNYIYSYQLSMKDAGFFIIQANFSCKNIEPVTEELTKKLFSEELKIDSKNLKNVLRNYETNYLFSREKYDEIARDFGYSFFYFKDPDYSKKYIELIKKVSIEDIRNVKKKYISPQKISLILLLPEEINEDEITNKINNYIIKTDSNRSNKAEEVIKLSNGINVSLYRKRGTNFFSINIASLAGMRLEEHNLAGLSYFVSSSILRGTKNKKYKEILQEIESMGGSLSGYSTKNVTGITGKFLTEDFEKSLALISDLLANFNPPKDEIEKVKKLTLEEIKRKKEKPTSVLRDLYFSEVFKGTTFALPTEGTEETITKFDENNVKEMFFNIFSPEKLYISLAGDIPDNYLEILRRYFESLPIYKKSKPKTIYPIKEIKSVIEKSKFNQSHIMLGFKIPGINSSLRANFHLLSQILSNQSGRLFVNLRDKKGLAYSVGSFIFEFPEASFFNLYIGTSPEKVETAKIGLINEIKDLFFSGITDDEIKKAKNQIIFNYSELMQKSSDISSTLVQNHIFFDNPFHFKNFIDEIKQIDANNFINQIKDYFKDENAFFIVLNGKEG